ncbi:MAG TPA: hypothetical protein VGE15_11770, partial [Sphingobacteriaceae bacterium]
MVWRFLGISGMGIFTFLTAGAQLVNKDAKIYIEKGVTVTVDGDVKVVSGELLNSGRLRLTGDWINNSILAGSARTGGHVIFIGADQRIAGTRLSAFGNLEFSGNGTKTLESDVDVFGDLILSDRQVNIAGSTLTVKNAAPSAITRTRGFIGTENGGKLIRNTNSEGTYLYPFGSSAAAIYRPLEVIPQTAD